MLAKRLVQRGANEGGVDVFHHHGFGGEGGGDGLEFEAGEEGLEGGVG